MNGESQAKLQKVLAPHRVRGGNSMQHRGVGISFPRAYRDRLKHTGRVRALIGAATYKRREAGRLAEVVEHVGVLLVLNGFLLVLVVK